MAKTKKDPLKKLSALMEKALQRGEKLERTLLKLVAQSEPGSAAEDLLKTVQNGIKTIRKNAKSLEKASAPSKKAPKENAKKSVKKPERRKAAPKVPATADISLPAEVNDQGPLQQ